MTNISDSNNVLMYNVNILTKSLMEPNDRTSCQAAKRCEQKSKPGRDRRPLIVLGKWFPDVEKRAWHWRRRPETSAGASEHPLSHSELSSAAPHSSNSMLFGLWSCQFAMNPHVVCCSWTNGNMWHRPFIACCSFPYTCLKWHISTSLHLRSINHTVCLFSDFTCEGDGSFLLPSAGRLYETHSSHV